MENKVAIIETTCADAESAKLIAETLVFERFAACAQIGSPITSIYRWKGKVENSEEFPIYIKTSPEKLEAAIARLSEIHPYECPQILFREENSSKSYAQWCAQSAVRQD